MFDQVSDLCDELLRLFESSAAGVKRASGRPLSQLRVQRRRLGRGLGRWSRQHHLEIGHCRARQCRADGNWNALQHERPHLRQGCERSQSGGRGACARRPCGLHLASRFRACGHTGTSKPCRTKYVPQRDQRVATSSDPSCGCLAKGGGAGEADSGVDGDRRRAAVAATAALTRRRRGRGRGRRAATAAARRCTEAEGGRRRGGGGMATATTAYRPRHERLSSCAATARRALGPRSEPSCCRQPIVRETDLNCRSRRTRCGILRSRR